MTDLVGSVSFCYLTVFFYGYYYYITHSNGDFEFIQSETFKPDLDKRKGLRAYKRKGEQLSMDELRKFRGTFSKEMGEDMLKNIEESKS